jgi:hypothetical protein
MSNNKQTPKEKAKELIDKFVLLDNDIFCSVNYPYSKQCALIAVDEIINVTVGLNGWIDGFQYWEEVKQEIENL